MKYINVSVEQPNSEDSYYSYWHDTVWFTNVGYSNSEIKTILKNIPKVELVDKYNDVGDGIISEKKIEEYLNLYKIEKVVVDYSVDIYRFKY